MEIPVVEDADAGGEVGGGADVDADAWLTEGTGWGGVLNAADGPPQAVRANRTAIVAPRRGTTAVAPFLPGSRTSRLQDPIRFAI